MEHELKLTIFVSLLVAICTFMIGYEMSESKNCELRGGEYSLDFGKCMNKEMFK